jgi:glycosyltransferase involved in cell wall biosynthesis
VSFSLRIAAHRLALGVLTRALRCGAARSAPARPGPVHILVLHTFGMGGTIRTSLNLLATLAQHRDARLTSVFRLRDEPFFDVPDGTRLTVLDDRRPGVRGGLLRRVLERLPSLLVHPRDTAYSWCRLWTDVQLVRHLRGIRSGVIISTRPAFNLLSARLARPGVIVVAQEHNNLGAHDPQLRAELVRRYPRLDALAVLTAGDRAGYLAALADPPRVEHIPNAVPDLPGDPAAERDSSVLSIGRLTHAKGFDLLIRAFAVVADRHPGWRLEIHGEGDQRPELEALVSQLGLGDRVALPGATRDVGPLLAGCGVFALSSRYEGFPMVLLEAMSKQAPVAAFDCPTGPADIVRDGENGLLLPPEDVDALAAGLDALIADPALRERIGRAARATAGEYSLEAIGARWTALLDALA